MNSAEIIEMIDSMSDGVTELMFLDTGDTFKNKSASIDWDLMEKQEDQKLAIVREAIKTYTSKPEAQRVLFIAFELLNKYKIEHEEVPAANTYYDILLKTEHIKTYKNWNELTHYQRNILIEIKDHANRSAPQCDRIEELSKFAINNGIDLNILYEAKKNNFFQR